MSNKQKFDERQLGLFAMCLWQQLSPPVFNAPQNTGGSFTPKRGSPSSTFNNSAAEELLIAENKIYLLAGQDTPPDKKRGVNTPLSTAIGFYQVSKLDIIVS
ncbi:hypothetical protein PDL71_16360 [Lacibacter sp. MH-610]|jgi:hypothetical protein|uniref:hypothetical protein n=1 Tax=Lacibacter sp. MH-610 TaxID=3020883 RepID=UPI0038921C2B